MPWWDDFEYSKPRPVKGGIKARSKRGAVGEHWWARRWTEALGRFMESRRLSRGRSYARKGQVISIEEKNGVVQARVQGSRPKPYNVRIELQVLDDETWERVLDVLAEQAIFTAQLLSGEVPPEVEQAFAAVGASLFPERARQLITNCSCPDPANPCKHIAAVYFLLGEAFDDDPFLLFRLRGRSQEQILEGLRARRAGVEAEEEARRAGQETVQPLPLDPASFWSMGQALEDFPVQIREPEVELSMLRRLGQPSFCEQDLEVVLGPVYRRMTAWALELAFEEDLAGEDD